MLPLYCSHPLKTNHLEHLLDKLVDLFSTGTSFSAFHEVQELCLARESTLGVAELEGPQEVVRLLEMRSNRDQLVDEICCATDSKLAQTFLDDRVIGDRDALLVELTEATLVDKLLNGRACGVTVGDIGFDQPKHSNGSLVEADECCVVQLAKTEQLHDSLGFGRHSNATTDSNHQGNLWLGGNEESTLGLGFPTGLDGSLLGCCILCGVFLCVGAKLLVVLDGLGSCCLFCSGLLCSDLLLSRLLL
mmetsp:Transcript_53851/g.80363  ORF Transcript_53851/g.80363 Transcript_53851/m.80363 type:complete len:247 (+) Transcript_53851:211-951(+)